MNGFRRTWARWVALFRDHELNRDFDDEVQSHIDLAAEDYVQRGVPLAEAQRLARLKFGSLTASKEAHRDSRAMAALEGFWLDFRMTLRGLRRDRAFTLSSIAILAVALGMNLTVFTIANAMLFRGYPLVRDNDRLLYLQERAATGTISYADFENWRSQTQSFEAIAYIGERFVPIRTGNERPQDSLAFVVSANTFGLLGVSPMLGRDFTPEDEAPGAAPVAILNHRFWATQLGMRRDIVGTKIYLNAIPTTVVGVMPEHFDFPTKENLWVPVTLSPELRRRGLTPGGFMAVARLRPGVSRDQAQAELIGVNRRLETAYPATNRELMPTVADYAESTSGEHAALIWGTAWAGACFVLLIACANLANLSLVRIIGRSREFATRFALGAPLGRVLRQAVVEGVSLAAVAGLAAWTIALWATRAWAVSTESRYQVLDYSLNSTAVLYLFAVSVTAALLFSLAPVINLARLASRRVAQRVRGERLASGLVAVQIALGVVLLSGTSILVRSVLAIVNAETGIRDPEKVYTGFVRLPSDKYPDPAARLAYFDTLEARIGSLAGVEGVSIASVPPISGIGERAFEIEGQVSSPDRGQSAQVLTTSPGYFHLIAGEPTIGRDFTPADRIGAQPAALVNQSFVEKFLPGQQAVGKRVRTVNANGPGDWRVIVGVVPNVMHGDGVRQTFRPLLYVPFRQIAAPQAFFMVRATEASRALALEVQRSVAAIDRDVPVEEFTNLKDSFRFDRDRMDAEHSELGKYASLAPAFSLLALLLAAVGLHAVIAHVASRRTKEIGIRMAIGASASDIRTMILRGALLPVALGIASGLAAALAVNRILASLLVGVSPSDPVTLIATPAVLAALALLAASMPARRAALVDPATVLRND